MLKNFIKITLRNLYKEKMYATINISGLSLGLACCIIIGLFLHSEFTYDRHNLKHKQIFRIVTEINNSGRTDSFPLVSPVLGPMLARDYAEIQAYVRFRSLRDTYFYHGNDAFFVKNVTMADKNVFDVFTHKIIYGDPDKALSDPYSAAVSQSFVKKFLGDTNPIGKIITTNEKDYKITLVFADLPENSHYKYNVLLSYGRDPDLLSDEKQLSMALLRPSVITYLLMPEGYQAESFQEIFGPFYKRYMEKSEKKIGFSSRTWLEPLADIHLNSNLQGDQPTGNKLYIYGLSAVALFILFVACVNYMNLATARSIKRGLEVGMRKVLGSTRTQLIAQFIGESIFFALIALILGLFLVELVFGFTPINELLVKKDLISFLGEPVLLFWIFGLGIAVGLLSGIYPALYLSSILPISALTGTGRTGRHGFRIRQALVLLQFIISISVISATILMAIQMHYIASKPLGLSKENQVIVSLRGADLIEKVPILKAELLKDSRILSSSVCNTIPGRPIGLVGLRVENNNGEMEQQGVSSLDVGEDFIKTMGIELVSGKDFSRDSLEVLVNEAMVKKMGWEEPLGKRVMAQRVVGVVKDFHFQSFRQNIEPLMIEPIQDDFSNMPPAARPGVIQILVIHISGEEIAKTLNYIEKVFTEIDPKHPFFYEFLDDIFIYELYMSDRNNMKLIGIFSGICILISCLGLFGLAAFTTEQRTKEIGVRKVLGASTFQIIVMLSRGILLIVLAASVVASLIAWFAIDEWLAGFAYHAGINPLVFVLSAAIAMAVAFGTVALQSFKTAQENPVKALRYE